MKAKTLFLALPFMGIAMCTLIAANIMEQGGSYHLANVAATPTTHDVAIASFAYTDTWEKGYGHMNSSYLVASLEGEGNYFTFQQTFRNVALGEGHLFSGTCPSSEPDFYIFINEEMVRDRTLLYTAGDYASEHKINLYGFHDLVSLEIQVGEGNELTLDTPNNDYVTCSYDSGTKTYTFTGDLNHYAYFSPDFPGWSKDAKLVIDHIAIHYNC